MRATRALAAVLLTLGAVSFPAVAADRGVFTRAIAEKLIAAGCITLTTRELRHFGYRGHAFFCEAADTGEVLGAVLTRSGVVRCFISGNYVGDGCYDFTNRAPDASKAVQVEIFGEPALTWKR